MIREIREADRNSLRKFFLSLSDQTVFFFNRWNGKYGKANTELAADIASQVITSSICKNSEDERGWLAVEVRVSTTAEKIGGILFPVTYDEVVGYGFLRFSPDKPTQKFTCSLGLVVADACQGKGVGKQLMQHMIDFAVQTGMRKIWLQTYADNKAAISLYRKFGFTTEGVFVNQEWADDKPLDVLSLAKYLPLNLGL